ncbi:hypothetical protein Trydic_g10573, partial [Trypoxylus dichotomus]
MGTHEFFAGRIVKRMAPSKAREAPPCARTKDASDVVSPSTGTPLRLPPELLVSWTALKSATGFRRIVAPSAAGARPSDDLRRLPPRVGRGFAPPGTATRSAGHSLDRRPRETAPPTRRRVPFAGGDRRAAKAPHSLDVRRDDPSPWFAAGFRQDAVRPPAATSVRLCTGRLYCGRSPTHRDAYEPRPVSPAHPTLMPSSVWIGSGESRQPMGRGAMLAYVRQLGWALTVVGGTPSEPGAQTGRLVFRVAGRFGPSSRIRCALLWCPYPPAALASGQLPFQVSPFPGDVRSVVDGVRNGACWAAASSRLGAPHGGGSPV